MVSASPSGAPQDPTVHVPAASPISPPQLTIVVVLVVSVYFIIGFYGKSLESYRINQRAEQVRSEVSRLEAENKVLQAQVAALSTDTYVETAARDKLNLARPGDRAVVILPAQTEVAWVEGPPPAAGPTRLVAGFGHVPDWVALFFGAR